MVQTSAAIGRVQLKHYDTRMAEIDRAMNRFWDLLEDCPGIKAHRPSKGEGTMGGWYNAKGIYKPEELGGLPIARFLQALKAEGVSASSGANTPMHLHPLYTDVDVYGDGVPTRLAGADPSRPDVRYESLPATEASVDHVFSVPWFKHYDEDAINQYATAFKKVAAHAGELMLAEARAEATESAVAEC